MSEEIKVKQKNNKKGSPKNHEKEKSSNSKHNSFSDKNSNIIKITNSNDINNGLANIEYDSNKTNNNCIEYLDSLDKKLSNPLQTYTPKFPIECIFYCFARLFNVDTVIIYFVIILLYSIFKYKHGYLVLYPIVHVISGLLVSLILKKSIGRKRPELKVYRFFKIREKFNDGSMPSGDSMQAGVFSAMIIMYFKSKFRYLAVLFMPIVMSGRVFFCCHYWFDTAVGALLGFTISVIDYYVILKIKK